MSKNEKRKQIDTEAVNSVKKQKISIENVGKTPVTPPVSTATVAKRAKKARKKTRKQRAKLKKTLVEAENKENDNSRAEEMPHKKPALVANVSQKTLVEGSKGGTTAPKLTSRRRKHNKSKKQKKATSKFSEEKTQNAEAGTAETDVIVVDSDGEEESMPKDKGKTPQKAILIESSSEDDDESVIEVKQARLLAINSNRVPLHESDLDRLKSDAWLNDACIEYGLDFLTRKYHKTKNVVVSSPFFYNKLQQVERDQGDIYEETRKWFRKDIFSHKYWLIPVNINNCHWILAFVLYPGHKNRSIVGVLDSYNRKNRAVVDLIVKFMRLKYQKEKGCMLRMPGIRRVVIEPQVNGYDCGMHLLRSAEMFLKRGKYSIKLLKRAKNDGTIRDLEEGVPIMNLRKEWTVVPVMQRRALRKLLLDYANSLNTTATDSSSERK